VHGIVWPWLLFGLVLGLHAVLPGRWVDGYVKDAQGRPLRYHLNGLLVFIITVGLWAAACQAGLLAWDAFLLGMWEL
jgi:hypothetical protein